ncbi:helix-turn-helix domain-containing protein [Acidisarcina polymorpha]|uniref:helix-turn-helix domain-containing protein n=1 Tax=Acidisarcina polymorpha TaxID=2211140 RepID=UPI001375215D|nr:AraC family transcriptional regulator [Acidisarcina polymorpha]
MPTCRKTQAVREFMRVESEVLFSSRGLGWSGLLMEQHRFRAGEWPASTLSGPILCLWNNLETLRCDHPDANGHFVPKLVHPGTLSFYTAGDLPPAHPRSQIDGLICAFDSDFLLGVPQEIMSESNTRSVADGVISQDKRCFMDAPVQHILERLSEAARIRTLGSCYANHLISLLNARLLHILGMDANRIWLRNKIDVMTLRRLTDRVDATPNLDLDLDTLAVERGCSKRHLLRSFRASTGRSPHQYILDLRIEKARRLMLKPALSLIDIAFECGFASQAHFTYAFRQRQGATPSDYRRRL